MMISRFFLTPRILTPQQWLFWGPTPLPNWFKIGGCKDSSGGLKSPKHEIITAICRYFWCLDKDTPEDGWWKANGVTWGNKIQQIRNSRDMANNSHAAPSFFFSHRLTVTWTLSVHPLVRASAVLLRHVVHLWCYRVIPENISVWLNFLELLVRSIYGPVLIVCQQSIVIFCDFNTEKFQTNNKEE